MSEVPSNLIPTTITQLPVAPVASEDSLLLIVYEGNNYQIRAGDLLSVAGVPTTRQVIAGTSLTGGGQLSSNVTLSVAPGGIGTAQLASSGVTPGTYGDSTNIPVFTVDSTGRVMAATTVAATISGYVPVTREVIAGTGLTGGGPLNANVTLAADLSNSTPLSVDNAGSAGVATDISRSDHSHPAIDLSNDNQVDNILGLDHGGTARSLVANAGAIIWSGADGLYVGPVGGAGQILQSNGTNAYIWVNQSTIDAGSANRLNGGAPNTIVYQSDTDVTSFLAAPTTLNSVLSWNGISLAWAVLPGTGTVTSINASGGTTGMSFTGGPVTQIGTLTLTGVLNVASGGTGASTLTGYVKGNGTSAMTASATIPNTDVTGLGTMSTQDAGSVAITGGSVAAGTLKTLGLTGYLKGNDTSAVTASSTIPNTDVTGLGTMSTQNAGSVAITGGNIDATAIGNTTPAAGAFTSVTMTSGTVSTPPSGGNDIVNKDYADAIATGINFHQACNYATTAALGTYVYNNGTLGVGATITKSAPYATLAIDGYTFVAPGDIGKRVLVKNEPSVGGFNAYNGVYTVTNVGSGATPWVLTRATDYDSSGTGQNEIDAGDLVLVLSGATNANTSWVQQTPLPIVVGTTGITFVQFAAPLVYTAGTGLNESPSYTFNIANTTVSSGNYGSASSVPTFSVNAQGQLTAASNASIAINGNQITSGTVGSSYISGSYTGITGVGTLTAGTWNASAIGADYGGTGLTGYTIGDVVYASGATTLSKLALGTSGYVLTAGASAPQYVAQSTLSVGSASTATSATTATNLAAGSTGSVPYQSSAGTTAFLGLGTNGYVLTAGSSSPQYVAQSTLSVGSASTATSATTATNLASGTTGSLPYQSSAGTTTFLAAGTNGYVLTMAGGVPSWAAAAATGVATFSGGSTGLTPNTPTTGAITLAGTLEAGYGGTGLASYTAGDLIYATGSTALSKLPIGTTNYVLTSSGTVPQYVAQSTLSVGSATTATNTTNIGVTANSANANNYLTFVSTTTGNLPALVNSSITCNPSTGKLTGGVSGGTF